MFLEINGIDRNVYMIASIIQDGNKLIYKMQNGTQLQEEFSTEQEATDKYNEAIEKGIGIPLEDGKIPAEYLPSYVDDIVDLIAVDSDAPASCAEGDKYYNTTSKLIYTAMGTNTWGDAGVTPEGSKIYLNISANPATSYRWSGTDLVEVGQDLSDYMTLDSAQTVTGVKTFSNLPESSATPTADNQLVNKKYVDDNAGGGGLAKPMYLGAMADYTENSPLNLDELDLGLYILRADYIDSSTPPFIWISATVDGSVVNGKLALNSASITGNNITLNLYSRPTDGNIFAYLYTREGSKSYTYSIKCDLTGEQLKLYIQSSAYSEYMSTYGNQTFYGVKTFASLPVSSNTPTNDNQLVNKKYVDGKAGGGNVYEIDGTNAYPFIFNINTMKPGVYTVSNSYHSSFKIQGIDGSLSGLCHTIDNVYVIAQYNDVDYDEVMACYSSADDNSVIAVRKSNDTKGYNLPSNPAGIWNYIDRWTLRKGGRTAYTPTTDYSPASKKYVDDSISSAVGNINTILATLTTPNNGGN